MSADLSANLTLKLDVEIKVDLNAGRLPGDRGFIFSTGYELKSAIKYLRFLRDSETQAFDYGPMSSWDVSRVTDFSDLFRGMTSFNPQPGTSDDISQWDTGAATTFDRMFERCCLFNLHLPWNTLKVDTMHSVFRGCTLFNNGGQPFTWHTGSVLSMNSMFRDCKSWNQDLPLVLNTCRVLWMDNMFQNCESWNQLVDFSVYPTGSRCLSMSDMFRGCTRLDQRVVLRAESVCYMQDMFRDCSRLTHMPSLSTTAELDNTSRMFMNCYKFNPLEPVVFTTSRVHFMTKMFLGCREFDQTVHLDTGSVNCMEGMFSGCQRFNNGGVSLVINMGMVECSSFMFEGCALFNQRLVSDEHGGMVDTRSVRMFAFMFYGCRSLNQPLFMTIHSTATVSSMFRLCYAQAEVLPVCTLTQHRSACMIDTLRAQHINGKSDKSTVAEFENIFLRRNVGGPGFGGPIDRQFWVLQRAQITKEFARSERIGGTALAAGAMLTDYDPDCSWAESEEQVRRAQKRAQKRRVASVNVFITNN